MRTSRRSISQGIDGAQGFTLFEFLVVILILGLFVTVASVNWTAFQTKGKESFLETFSLETGLLREEAVSRYEERIIQFDLANNGMTLGRIDKTRGFTALKEVAVPRGYRLRNVSINGQMFSTAKPIVRFYPTGMVDRTIVHLDREGSEPYSIIVDPVTARVQGKEGYIEEVTAAKRNQSP